MDWYPLRFQPLYKERVWGGRALESIFGRALPGTAPIGESWEITDRAEGSSVVAHGPLAGRTLGSLVADHPQAFGNPPSGRFPILVKILDAREVLSLQVHPPAAVASQLGGEPKTELWYFVRTEPGAVILAGVKPGMTRDRFTQHIEANTVADCFHRIPVHAGDAMFLPSGRVHALGAGLVLFEIQENSDTTYRVFDWNRTGLDGRPRQLHIRESLESIDFQDTHPRLVDSAWRRDEGGEKRTLVHCPLFSVEARRGFGGTRHELDPGHWTIVGAVHGTAAVHGGGRDVVLAPGDFVLIPGGTRSPSLSCDAGSEVLVTVPGGSPPPDV